MPDLDSPADDGRRTIRSRNNRAHQRIYIRSVYARWKKEIGEVKVPILVFSPYLTSRAAENVLLLTHDKASCEVYTLFEPMVFVIGSSSIRTLRSLVREGIKLYSLPGIHAKMVIVKGRFASIGSQNLTRGGRRRLESTFTTTDIKEVGAIWERALVWCAGREAISPEMIEDMERSISGLARDYRMIARRSEKLANELSEAEGRKRREAAERERRAQEERGESERRRREEEESRRAKEEAARRAREAEDAERVREAAELEQSRMETTSRWREPGRRSRESVRAKIYPIASHRRGDWRTIHTLRAGPGSDLTTWTLEDGREVNLRPLQRYPCLLEESWKLGFARLGKTGITLIARNIQWSADLRINNLVFSVGFTANWEESQKPYNVACDLSCQDRGWKFNVPAWFELDSLGFRDRIEARAAGTAHAHEALAWFKESQEDVRSALLGRLLRPFKYEHALTGVYANRFFGPVGGVHYIRVVLVEQQPILVVSPR